MKKFFYFPLLLCLLCCYPSYSQKNSDWSYYTGLKYIDASNCEKFTDLTNTPESVVTYFFSSKIRNDDNWMEVMPADSIKTLRLKNKLIAIGKLQFVRFRLLGRKNHSETRTWIKIFMEFEENGIKKKTINQVAIDLMDGKWTITNVPS